MIDACHACAGRGEGGCVRAVNCRHRSRDRIRTQRQSARRIEWANAFYGPHRGHLHGRALGVVVERARPLRRYGLRLVKRMNGSITQLHQLMYLLTATYDRPEPRATTEEAQSFALSSVCISSSCSGISSACGLAEHADLIDALSSRARSARPPASPAPAPSAGSAGREGGQDRDTDHPVTPEGPRA